MKISIRNKPLNHTRWFFIYLICFLLGFCIQGYGENTQTVHVYERVTYEWPLYTNAVRIIHMWRLINGTPKVQVKAPSKKTRSEYGQPPLDTQALLPQARPASGFKRKQRQHPQSLEAQGVSHFVQDALSRRGYRSSGRERRGHLRRTTLRLGNSLQRPDTKRSSTTVLAGSPAQREMHRASYRSLSVGGASWSSTARTRQA